MFLVVSRNSSQARCGTSRQVLGARAEALARAGAPSVRTSSTSDAALAGSGTTLARFFDGALAASAKEKRQKQNAETRAATPSQSRRFQSNTPASGTMRVLRSA